MPRPPSYCIGNAADESVSGWFIGQFMPHATGDARRREDIEIKWGVHPQGEVGHPDWVHYRSATSISILIEGACRISVRNNGHREDVELRRRGDYLLVEPGIQHTWEALTACVVLTVRWPSVAGDQIIGTRGARAPRVD